MSRAHGLRVCTWNVHGWCDAWGRLGYARAEATLRALNVDVIALQEVFDPERLAHLDEALSTRHAYAPAAWGANALLARPALLDPCPLALDALGGELRSAVRAGVTLGGVRVTVAATHLDVHDEAVRCAQYAQLAAALPQAAPAVLLGDFNALRPSDYDPQRRREITDKRRDAGLDPPDRADPVEHEAVTRHRGVLRQRDLVVDGERLCVRVHERLAQRRARHAAAGVDHEPGLPEREHDPGGRDEVAPTRGGGGHERADHG